MSRPLIEVAEPKVGELYHLAWARKNGMVWRLIEICGDTVIMQTPKTKKRLTAKRIDLRHTRAQELKLKPNGKEEEKTNSTHEGDSLQINRVTTVPIPRREKLG